ncbi:MAG: CotH kinase family protein [Bacteroidota bacterium]
MNRTIRYLLLATCLCSFGFYLGAQAPTPSVAEQEERISVEFSLPGGFYDESVEVALSSPGARIYYTTDGQLPNRRSRRYTKAIRIESTTLLQAVAYQSGRKSKIKGRTFFINEPASTFPTVSLGIKPATLFDPETGLYVQGPNAIDSLWTKDGANFWSRREIPIYTEFYETNRKKEFSSPTGFRLFGGMSRLFPQKSMTLVMRDRYGKKNLKHRLFGPKGKKKFKYLVLRNSGSDWGKAHFRDAFMTGLLRDWDLEVQAYRPAHVYLNGDYWGIYNIREKINRTYIAQHFDLEKDSIDLIEHKSSLKRGSRRHYLRLLRFLKKNSLADPANYAYVRGQMEVENFMDYQIAQIYFDNQDAGGNIRFWRPQTPTGRWRWILYDTDWGFGLHNASAYRNNSLEFHTAPDGPSWPNPPWSTFILRHLLENPTFARQFVNRFADHLNVTFQSEQVKREIERHEQLLLPEIGRHFERWKLSRKNWEAHLAIMKKFAARRPVYVRSHLQDKFATGAPGTIRVSSDAGGQVLLNDHLRIVEERFSGLYFSGVPIHLKAIPNYGYRFVRWEGIEAEDESYDLSLYVNPERAIELRAVFEPYVHPLTGKLIFNEVNPNAVEAGDWVELYNNSEEMVDLTGWVFTDSKHEFVLPTTLLAPQSYLILCQDSSAFRRVYPEVENVLGNFNFGLSKRREELGLYDQNGASIDSLGYHIEPLDTAFALALLLPSLNNHDPENWELIAGLGTPKSANPYYLESRIRAEQGLWVRMGIALGLLLCGMLVLQMRHSYRQKQMARVHAQPPAIIPPAAPESTGDHPEPPPPPV